MMHTNIINSMLAALNAMPTLEHSFQVEHEFSVFGGLLPVDSVVFHEGRPVAFVEIDGVSHDSPMAKRKDKLKELFYKFYYPEQPMYRINFRQCDAIGDRRAGQALAAWIARDFPPRAGPGPEAR